MLGKLKGLILQLFLSLLFVDCFCNYVSLGCLLLFEGGGRDEVETEEDAHFEYHSHFCEVCFLVYAVEAF